MEGKLAKFHIKTFQTLAIIKKVGVFDHDRKSNNSKEQYIKTGISKHCGKLFTKI